MQRINIAEGWEGGREELQSCLVRANADDLEPTEEPAVLRGMRAVEPYQRTQDGKV